MNTGDRDRKGSWVSRLPQCLKLFTRREDDHKPRRAFRPLHMPDRPARSSSTLAIPTDEECLQHLLALQQQAISSSERDSVSKYRWEDDDVFPFLHGIGPSKGDVLRAKKCPGTRPPGLDAGKLPGWDAVVTRPMRPPFTPDSSGPWENWDSPQHGNFDVVTMRASGQVLAKEQYSGQNRAPRALTHGTWPARHSRYTTGRASRSVWAAVHRRSSLPPEWRSDADDSDDVYDGWEEYYFDDTNFRDRDQEGRCMGRTGPTMGLSFIEEFI